MASIPSVTFDLTPRQIADQIITRITRPEDCYEESEIGAQLIPALAPLPDHIIDGFAFDLKKRFSKDFSGARNQRWWSSIRASRESQRQHTHEESPFKLTSNGNYISNLYNAKVMLRQLPIAFNSFTNRSFLTSRSPWGHEGNWVDHDDTMAAEWCQGQGLNVDSRQAAEAAESIARERPPVQPVIDYLSSIEWDHVSRCDLWLIRCLGVADDPIIREVSAKWLIAAVKRVFEPGCQSDYTLVLEGSQGLRKSTALRTLAGSEWFSDDISDIGSKDAAMQLQGKWIIELSELDAIRRARETSTTKSWLTRRDDNFRPPYGRRTQTFPRQNVFAATTNREDWGSDETGLRRFWPVKVGEIDIEKLTDNRDQIWAEAVHRYCAGENTWLDRDSETAISHEQSKRQDSDSWEELILEWSDAPAFKSGNSEPPRSRSGRVLVTEILEHCIGIPPKEWTPMARQRVTRVLKLNKYNCKRASKSDDEGRRPEFWERRPG